MMFRNREALRQRTDELVAYLGVQAADLPPHTVFSTIDIWSGPEADARVEHQAAQRASRIVGGGHGLVPIAVLMPAHDGVSDMKTLVHFTHFPQQPTN